MYCTGMFMQCRSSDLQCCLEAQRQGEIHRLESRAAAKEPATGDQQCALPGSAMDPIQRPGRKDPLAGCSPIAQRLEAALWF